MTPHQTWIKIYRDEYNKYSCWVFNQVDECSLNFVFNDLAEATQYCIELASKVKTNKHPTLFI